jgi:hypothetical protein
MPRQVSPRHSASSRGAARADLQRLDDLALDPEAQFALALQYVERSSNLEILRRALSIVQAAANSDARPVLHHAYDRSDAKSDSGGFVRALIVRALRPIAHPDDQPLLERALLTYQMVGMYDTAGELRSAALLALNDINPDLAALHAARFLTDPQNGNSGEPALSALRILAAQQNLPPVFAFAVWRQGSSDLNGEALRLLVDLPESLVWLLVTVYRDREDEQELLGLYDLLLAHPARSRFRSEIDHFLRTTGLIDLYGLVAMQVVVTRDPDLIGLLREVEMTEADALRRSLLEQALSHA